MKEPTPVPPPALTAYHFVLRHPTLEPSQRPRLANYANNVASNPVAFKGEVRPTAFVGGKRALAKTLVDRFTKLGWEDVTDAFRTWQQESEAAALAPDTAGAPLVSPNPPGEVKPPPADKADGLVPVDTADEVKGPAQEERPPVLSKPVAEPLPESPAKPPEASAELGGHRPPDTASSMTRDLPASGRGVRPEVPARGQGGGNRGGSRGGKAKATTSDEAPSPPAAG